MTDKTVCGTAVVCSRISFLQPTSRLKPIRRVKRSVSPSPKNQTQPIRTLEIVMSKTRQLPRQTLMVRQATSFEVTALMLRETMMLAER